MNCLHDGKVPWMLKVLHVAINFEEKVLYIKPLKGCVRRFRNRGNKFHLRHLSLYITFWNKVFFKIESRTLEYF